uniref:Uncharacterized protein n=1 Tax=Caenorhabditis japonica TaxID=281687 RepID=A0A8R1E9Y9_CAEJA
MKTQVCIHRSVCVSSSSMVFAWSPTNKWAEFRVLMSQVDGKHDIKLFFCIEPCPVTVGSSLLTTKYTKKLASSKSSMFKR